VVHVASSALRSAALVLGGIAVGVGAVVGANALTGDDGPTRLGRPALAEGAAPLLDPERLAEVEGPRTRSGSAREAVEAFLAAERAGDHTTSFAHLADSVRVEYGSAQAWAADHPDVLPPVVDFTVEGADPGDGGARPHVLGRGSRGGGLGRGRRGDDADLAPPARRGRPHRRPHVGH
jgi:hypothetical protein